MPTVRTIYIFCEKGLEVLIPHAMAAIKEVLACFPEYKDNYVLENLGAWRSQNCLTVLQDGRNGLKEYESVDWYISHARYRATEEGRWQMGHIISAEQLWDDLSSDPYSQGMPQCSFLITKYGMYFGDEDFCMGVTKPDAFSIVSTAGLLDEEKNLNIERFKTLVMNEFGHLINLTPEHRENTIKHFRTDCKNIGCIMRYCSEKDVANMTQIRLDRNKYAILPLCDDCLKAGELFFSRKLSEYNHSHGIKSRAKEKIRYIKT